MTEGHGDERDKGERDEDVRRRAEPEQPPVDGPTAGSPGEEDEQDLGDTSYGEPGGSG